MSNIEELNVSFDPFADVDEDNKPAAQGAKNIHLRVQQRNGRKTLTTLQGLPKEYDAKKILKSFKKEFACNGTIVEDPELGQILQLSGDQRLKIAEFLVSENIAKKTDIKVHGF
ncbi:Eukaryotic translation initiation factor eIF-1 [Rhizopus azygosporus]|uniref:Eukaryotic translation initiation factor 1b-like protein n=3 Tax=Rhizopus TaxID=4842 RepID=A0A2G4SR67_RHIZD|nr:eukaryotic translation initiation factor 1b-like protein [Rhizopus microsporus ATCC 52813]ORE01158.1 translation initiation factor SUI1 [Rhizopus microsporus var. microsporus]RCH92412.1 Eukaryotic translation initiation factor eIF-1 [Rhizopus azygosporus]CEG73703.1 Putative Translation initiation factor SUI1 [Rhizopus microsporus]PHZ11232.1 eukaryotic translation initiation factor 1b-like protein [Rhizopus microsporus ATCC 52813]CEG82542.1 Putative Translation initiation factor SUI1 [Rhizop